MAEGVHGGMMDMKRARTAFPLSLLELGERLERLNSVGHEVTKEQAWDAFEAIIADGWTVSWQESGYTLNKGSQRINSWDAWEERHASRN